MKKKITKKAVKKSAGKATKKAAVKSKLPAKKKKVMAKKAAAKPAMRSVSLESVEDFPPSVLMKKGDFVIEKFSDTKYCCMRVLPDGRREEHICYSTENGARRHLANKH